MRSYFLSLTMLAILAGSQAVVAAPPGPEGREANPVAREFYESVKPLVEDVPAAAPAVKGDPDLCTSVLAWLMIPLGIW